MKKTFAVAALSGLIATVAYAGALPRTGVLNSPHDMNVVTGLSVPADNQGRACAFCHTPHHAVDLGGAYNPLWSHQPTAIAGIPYASATFDAGKNSIVDPLIGPTRLCMSCHDGAIAPDQHYGSANVAPTGRFASDEFAGYPSAVKNIAVGKGGDFSNDHPVGFDVAATNTDTGLVPNVWTSAQFLVHGVPGGKTIQSALHTEAGVSYMTCATCHDVHNKENVANDVTTQQDANHVDSANLNYFVYAPQSGSQLCLSCHAK